MERDDDIRYIIGRMNLDDSQRVYIEASLRRMSDFEFDRQMVLLKRLYVEDIGA